MEDHYAIVNATIVPGKLLKTGVRCSNTLTEDQIPMRYKYALFSGLVQCRIAIQMFKMKHIKPMTRDEPRKLINRSKSSW